MPQGQPSPAPGPIIAIVGATATGKSLLADALAQGIGGEVVSADSMQVYTGMDIGTAKTPVEERSVPYHGIDLVPPGEAFTAALYQRYARAAIDDIQHRQRVAVFCGGTGLYLRAALDNFDLDEQIELDGAAAGAVREGLGITTGNSLRSSLAHEAGQLGAEGFHARLAEADPLSAALIHPNNVRRVIRAFELLQQGSSYAEASAGFNDYQSRYQVCYIGLTAERSLLNQLIGNRVDAMISQGLLGEVQVLLAEGLRDAMTASQAIGYKELIAVLDGQASLADATEAIKQATRRYAKRQQTWFKRDPRIEWLDASDLHSQYLSGQVSRAELGRQLLALAINETALVHSFGTMQ